MPGNSSLETPGLRDSTQYFGRGFDRGHGLGRGCGIYGHQVVLPLNIVELFILVI